MKSHVYDFGVGDVARLLGGLLAPMVLFALVMRLGAGANLLPFPWPALDVDHTILTHQAQVSQTAGQADILLLGDSSCLMDISGDRLEELLQGTHHAINLGSFMYVGLEGNAAMLSRYVSANPGRLRAVVVLLHPEMLRGIEPVPHYLQFLSDYYARADFAEPDSFGGRLRGIFGLEIFQDRLLSRTPLPLPGEYGRYYGFNLDLYGYMNRQHGSATDPNRYVASAGQGNADYRLARNLEPRCMALRAAVPPEASLAIGITPVPQSFAQAHHTQRCRDLVREWGQWMQADLLLTNLPPTMPDSCFASTTHLNLEGARLFTKFLAQSLRQIADRPGAPK